MESPKGYINESGEYIRGADAPVETSPQKEFMSLYDAFGAQSVEPEGVVVPDDTFYYKGERLAHYKSLMDKLIAHVEQNGISEVTASDGRKVNVQNFIDKIKRSIEFSEQNPS